MADEDQPLKDEAAAREKWRGAEDGEKPQAPGRSLPASEDEDERSGAAASEGGGTPFRSPGTISPPD
ncbi:MAG TPA: hypothetical protein VF655_10785 [Allosphingosinicella sp.]|jgi:hypothetical protein